MRQPSVLKLLGSRTAKTSLFGSSFENPMKRQEEIVLPRHRRHRCDMLRPKDLTETIDTKCVIFFCALIQRQLLSGNTYWEQKCNKCGSTVKTVLCVVNRKGARKWWPLWGSCMVPGSDLQEEAAGTVVHDIDDDSSFLLQQILISPIHHDDPIMLLDPIVT